MVQRPDADRVFARARVGEHPDRAEVRNRVRVQEERLEVAQLDQQRVPGSGHRAPQAEQQRAVLQEAAPLDVQRLVVGLDARRPRLALLGAALDRAHDQPLARPRAQLAQLHARVLQPVVDRPVQPEAVAGDLDRRLLPVAAAARSDGPDARDPRALGLQRPVLGAEVRAEHVQVLAPEVARLGVLGLARVVGRRQRQPDRLPAGRDIVAAMAEDRDRRLDHPLVEHGDERLIPARDPARDDGEVGGLVRVQVEIDGVRGLIHWQHLRILPCR